MLEHSAIHGQLERGGDDGFGFGVAVGGIEVGGLEALAARRGGGETGEADVGANLPGQVTVDAEECQLSLPPDSFRAATTSRYGTAWMVGMRRTPWSTSYCSALTLLSTSLAASAVEYMRKAQ